MTGGAPFLTRVHHLGVAVRDLDSAMEVYGSLLGLRLLSGPFDDPIQKVRVCFVGGGRAGGPELELIAPLGEQSPITQYLQKEIGAYHVCYEVDDIDASVAHLRDAGCLLVSGPAPAVAFDERPIAWMLLPTRHLIELVQA